MPTGFGLNGNSPEIVAGIEAAVRDGMDVINLSLGEAEIEPSRDIVAAALDGRRCRRGAVVAAGNNFEELGAARSRRRELGPRDHGRRRERDGRRPTIASFSSGGPDPLSSA